MRILSFILAFAFVFAAPNIAPQDDRSLPGVGTFNYGGSPAPAVMDQAHLTLTKRVRA